MPWFVDSMQRDLKISLAKEETMPKEHMTIMLIYVPDKLQGILGDSDPITILTPRSLVPHLVPGQMTGREDHLLPPVRDANFVTDW